MNLIERAREAAIEIGSTNRYGALAAEIAGEVERCWTCLEEGAQKLADFKAEVGRLTNVVAERDAEIERLKAAKDLEALARASEAGFQHGFRTAVTTLWPVVGTLLKDHHHGKEA